MKTKLLKKIRKQYSIVYYPNGYKNWADFVWHRKKYVVRHILDIRPTDYLDNFETKQDAIEFILRGVRIDYAKYSRNYNKPNYIGIKVWYVK